MASADVTRVVEMLRRGSVVAVATDTVFGLVCDPNNQKAVNQIFKLKGRNTSKPLQVLAADMNVARQLVDLPEHAERLVKEWPGPLTLVAHARARPAKGVGMPASTTERAKLGVRVPQGGTIQQLLHKFGPLAATSANPSSQKPAITRAQVRQYFSTEQVPIIIGDDNEVTVMAASRVVDVTRLPHLTLRRARATRS